MLAAYGVAHSLRQVVQIRIFPSLRTRPEGISHISLVLLESSLQISSDNCQVQKNCTAELGIEPRTSCSLGSGFTTLPIGRTYLILGLIAMFLFAQQIGKNDEFIRFQNSKNCPSFRIVKLCGRSTLTFVEFCLMWHLCGFIPRI